MSIFTPLKRQNFKMELNVKRTIRWALETLQRCATLENVRFFRPPGGPGGPFLSQIFATGVLRSPDQKQ